MTAERYTFAWDSHAAFAMRTVALVFTRFLNHGDRLLLLFSSIKMSLCMPLKMNMWWGDMKCVLNLQVINGTVYQKQPVQEYRNSKLVRRFWDLFLGSWLGEMPEGVSWQRGAEFLVSKSRILAHPRRFYIDALSFLAEYPKVGIGLGPGGTRPIARMTSSDLQIAFERLWPYLFGEPAMFENPSIARCDLFICEGDL